MFWALKPLISYLKLKQVVIYDNVFVIHTKVTVIFLLACSLFISAKQYFGEAIECIADSKSTDFIASFCWVFGTYILDSFDDNKVIGKSSVAIGVGPENVESTRIYQRYYQWVVLILLFQAPIFHFPAYLWKIWEGGRLQQLCDELGSVVVPEAWNANRKDVLIQYFSSDFTNIHLYYALEYFFCEFLNFVVCILNVILLNTFFSGFWMNFAPALGVALDNNWDEWNRYSSRVFPKVAKCEFLKFGHSGSAQKYDALCLLPLNILNEKLFAFFWCWFLGLTLVSGLNICYRIFTILCRSYRIHILARYAGHLKISKIRQASNNANIGDWYLLYKVGRTINPILFRELIEQLSEKKAFISESKCDMF